MIKNPGMRYPKSKLKNAKKTDKRLSGLLSRIRSETPSKINLPRKIRKSPSKI